MSAMQEILNAVITLKRQREEQCMECINHNCPVAIGNIPVKECPYRVTDLRAYEESHA